MIQNVLLMIFCYPTALLGHDVSCPYGSNLLFGNSTIYRIPEIPVL
jgi:hypothetical protein